MLLDEEDKKLTRFGGEIPTQGHYENLPDFLHKKFSMLGATDRGSSDKKSLYLPEKLLYIF